MHHYLKHFSSRGTETVRQNKYIWVLQELPCSSTSLASLRKCACLCQMPHTVWNILDENPRSQMYDALHKQLIGLISWQVTYILLCSAPSFSASDQSPHTVKESSSLTSHIRTSTRWKPDSVILVVYVVKQHVRNRSRLTLRLKKLSFHTI